MEGGGREHIYVLRKNGSIQKNSNPVRLQIIRRHRWLKRACYINAAVGEEAVAMETGSRIPPRASVVCREHFRHRERRWKFGVIHSSERDKRRAILLLFGSSYSRVFILWVQNEIENQY
ncbi:hypothetical protein CEXT_171751 [Caerostris extrusa]|uniref:THAP-type domain-containing protein n=1 Tax=Caerostris extrusa TaxID=172846 RepID=A0AAV4V3Z2_CAEEX|nr:hypothetical protein CEXT_171751 [Caerostris extrusa]